MIALLRAWIGAPFAALGFALLYLSVIIGGHVIARAVLNLLTAGAITSLAIIERKMRSQRAHPAAPPSPESIDRMMRDLSMKN